MSKNIQNIMKLYRRAGVSKVHSPAPSFKIICIYWHIFGKIYQWEQRKTFVLFIRFDMYIKFGNYVNRQ